ncbi:MAG: inosine/xanthosine triphosphatase [Planctomycetota bacterium]
MSQQINIAVGSKNPVKINAALNGFRLAFPLLEFQSEGFDVESGVSDQPMSSEETLTGARNRVSQLKTVAQTSDYWVGIEGGIEIIGGSWFASAWIVIDGKSKTGRAKSGLFPLPPEVQRLVEGGLELGHANDLVFDQLNSKQTGGAVGSLTNGRISRRELYEHAMTLALIPFLSPSLFPTPGE